MPNTAIIRLEHLRKVFRVGTHDIEVLRDISFDIFPGEFLIIVGPSGCGKSTLLHTVLGLEPPTSGSVIYKMKDFHTFNKEPSKFNKNIYTELTVDERALFRKHHLGMVYQQANWIRSLNVRENVAFPLSLMGVGKSIAFNKTLKLLNSLGLAAWSECVPTELSGGHQQRLSLARALINNPEVIIADEPTGNLDYKSGSSLLNILRNLNKESHKTIVMVTHDLSYIKYASRVIHLLDGAIEKVEEIYQ